MPTRTLVGAGLAATAGAAVAAAAAVGAGRDGAADVDAGGALVEGVVAGLQAAASIAPSTSQQRTWRQPAPTHDRRQVRRAILTPIGVSSLWRQFFSAARHLALRFCS